MTKKAEKASILPAGAVPGLVLPQIAQWCVEETVVFTEEDSPVRGRFQKGDARVLLIVGENASGKSLAFRLICQIARQEEILPITISIRERTGSGSHDMARMARTFMFGDETEKSTGANSARVVESGFQNVRRECTTILGLDEPEIGLSEGYAEALGELIGMRSRELDASCCGVIVVTHSRRLARGLIKGLQAEPSFLRMGENPGSLSDWIASDEKRTVEELLALPTVGVERFRAINKLLKA